MSIYEYMIYINISEFIYKSDVYIRVYDIYKYKMRSYNKCESYMLYMIYINISAFIYKSDGLYTSIWCI